jgi:hypothetical protein
MTNPATNFGYEGLPCMECGDGLGNVHEGERLRKCRHCGGIMHSECAAAGVHLCDEEYAADREKLARWTAASKGAKR